MNVTRLRPGVADAAEAAVAAVAPVASVTPFAPVAAFAPGTPFAPVTPDALGASTAPSGHRSHADLGGERGHGRVVGAQDLQPEDELWHAPWEPRAMALTLAMGATGAWNLDMSRAARESLPEYRKLSYYEIWVRALEKLLAERGLATAREIALGRSLHPPRAVPRVLRSRDVATVLARGAPTERPCDVEPRFGVGDAVRTFAGAVPHHTRLPGYARGKRGVVVGYHGAHVFADAHASGLGEMPCHLYTVAFDGTELWRDEADRVEAQGCTISIDAWEPYLDPA